MNKKLFVTLLALPPAIILCFSITAAAAKPDLVEVVNTPDVNVVNLPAVQQVTGSVEVTNTPDVNVANSVQVTDLIPIAWSMYKVPGQGSPSYNEIPPGYLHSLSLTVATVDPVGKERCAATAIITFLEPLSWDVISRTRLMTVASAAGSASNAHDFTTPIAVLYDPDDYDVVLEVQLVGDASNGCLVGLGGVYEEANQ